MLKWLRRWYWIVSTFVRKYVLGITIGIILGVALFFEFPKLVKYIPLKPTHVVGRVGLFTLKQLPLDIQEHIGRGLTQIDQNGKTSLDIAQTVSVSPDGKTYAFTIKPDTYWSNGQRLHSSDIDLNLPDINVAYPTPESIVFTLQEPFAPFMSIVSQPLLKRTTSGIIFKKTAIIGTNTFQVNQIKLRQQYLSSLQLSNSQETLVYQFYPTEDDALVAFKTGQIDTIEMLSQPLLSDWPNTKVTASNDDDRYLAVFFNTADPSLQDKTVRQLLTYAIPKTTSDNRVISPIAKSSWVYNPQVKPYAYNLDTARSMLEKIKAANPAFNLHLVLTTTPAYNAVAQNIITSWTSLGIDATLKLVAFPDTNDYQALLIGQQIPRDPDQYTLWHSTQSTNITKYQSPKIDKLLEDGRQELDPEKRKAIYQDFQRFLVEDCPAAFLERLPTYTLERT